MANRDWIVAHDGTKGNDSYMLECRRCGDTQRFAVPINVGIYVAAMKVFQRQHADCKIADTAKEV